MSKILVVAEHDGRTSGAQRHSIEDDSRVIRQLKETGTRAILALNKIDLFPHDRVLPVMAKLNAEGVYDEIFMTSAEKGDSVEKLAAAIASRMPEGEALYPPYQIADLPMRVLAAEVTREKLMLRLHQELPYATTVITEQWQAKPDGSARLEQTIFVERESQRAIVLGKGGATIKLLGETARKEMETQFGHKVHLFLHVKVRENWADDPMHYREMGLDLPEGQ